MWVDSCIADPLQQSVGYGGGYAELEVRCVGRNPDGIVVVDFADNILGDEHLWLVQDDGVLHWWEQQLQALINKKLLSETKDKASKIYNWRYGNVIKPK